MGAHVFTNSGCGAWPASPERGYEFQWRIGKLGRREVIWTGAFAITIEAPEDFAKWERSLHWLATAGSLLLQFSMTVGVVDAWPGTYVNRAEGLGFHRP